ncbi:MAG: 16S rRNA (cytosine(1402)-N(4))-methyltransferase RsmH [Verrucomicrobiales bacterium]|nr:16S rRNA (cytosine(1402)-N(4))-methyltransferase RsmH [Verrucomicrobiales bacterium]MCP5560602.1 16S rRNA (cytosine(1402)-N(4))-methyltransferase RsmH [Verrucomicrobiaceae bacterium]
MDAPSPESETPHRRRPRYSGKNPRRFEDKYKELNPESHAETVSKVRASGKTPAGQHVPIMLREIVELCALTAGQRVVDCTLGYGGHASALLQAVQPGGSLLGLDQDPLEIQRTEQRLRKADLPAEAFLVRRTNFAGLRRAMEESGWSDGADAILADLGVSSMQIDNPARGFSFKHDGPLDMRMNPQRGLSARELLRKISADKLSALLAENADERQAPLLSRALSGQDHATTRSLATAIRAVLPARMVEEDIDSTVRRVFQALRIAVNEEFNALETLLRQIPECLRSGGRVVFLTFHSGEDRRVKQAFRDGVRNGIYSATNEEVLRASSQEVRDNPRASSAKLRWAVRS